MKLEDEIQQKSFKSPQHKLAINIAYTSNWLSNYYSNFFKEYKISLPQYNVLRILRGQHPNHCSLKLIKERMVERMSDTSRLVDKLVAKGYVMRIQCPQDRRSVNLTISEKGLKLLKKLDFIDDATTEIFKNVSTKQIEQVNEFLDLVRDNELNPKPKK